MRYLIILLACWTTLTGQTAAPFGVEIRGSGDPLVLIPGLGCAGEVWTATVDELSANYECHVLTLAGFGGQDPLESTAEFLPPIRLAIIDYLEQFEQPAVLIGHSLGGFTSLGLALERPDLIDRIIIVDSYPFYSAAMQPGITVEQIKGQAEFMRESMMKASAENYARQQQQMMPIMVQDSLGLAKVIDWSEQSDRASVGQAMFELMTTDLRPRLNELKTPTLVMGAWASGRDYGLTEAGVQARLAEQYADGGDQVQIKMAASAYHFIMFDEPVWFMDQLWQFLRQ